MTFIDEELETLRQSPDYRRFLKVYIKYQMHTLCQKLADVGEESFVVTASVADGTFSQVGSSGGDEFLQKISDLKWKFLCFCSSPDRLPESFVSVPVTRDGSPNPAHTESQLTIIEENSETSEDVRYIEQETAFPEQDTQYIQSTDGTTSFHLDQEMTFPHSLYRNVGSSNALWDQNHQAVEASQRETDHKDEQFYDRSSVLSKYRDMTELNSDIITPGKMKSEPESDDMEEISNHTSSLISHETISEHETKDSGHEIQNMVMVSSLGLAENVTKWKSLKPRIKRIYCKFCNEGFFLQEHYINHLKHHKSASADRPYSCTVCYKSFSGSTNLKNHMRIHTGERPYKCSLCDKSFTKSTNLKHHMSTHSDERPYACEMCYKSFTLLGNLRRHMKLHNGNSAGMAMGSSARYVIE